MSEAAPPEKKRSSGKAKKLTPEKARETILTKLQKGGVKGALISPQKNAAKEQIYVEAVAALEGAREIWVDRRKAKPRYYLWSLRPPTPTTESVATKLERIARERYPAVATEADLKKALAKEEQSLLASALVYALEARLLVCLFLRSGKTTKPLYASASALFNARWEKATPNPEPAAQVTFDREGRQFSVTMLDPEPAVSLSRAVRAAYGALVRRTGFPAVNISRLQSESGVEMGELKGWLLDEYQCGRAVLSEGDWSLATEEERRGVIEVQGQRCILARLLS